MKLDNYRDDVFHTLSGKHYGTFQDVLEWVCTSKGIHSTVLPFRDEVGDEITWYSTYVNLNDNHEILCEEVSLGASIRNYKSYYHALIAAVDNILALLSHNYDATKLSADDVISNHYEIEFERKFHSIYDSDIVNSFKNSYGSEWLEYLKAYIKYSEISYNQAQNLKDNGLSYLIYFPITECAQFHLLEYLDGELRNKTIDEIISKSDEYDLTYLAPHVSLDKGILHHIIDGTFVINDDGSIDVEGHVSFECAHIKKIPFKFGRVTGNFDLSYNDELIDLENRPDYVGADFWYPIHIENPDLPSKVIGRIKGI